MPEKSLTIKISRRRARSLAFQALFEIDVASHQPEAVINRLLENTAISENAAFIRQLVVGVLDNKEKIDRQIKIFAPAWPLEQISAVDRNILRLAIYEVLLDNVTPVKVAIDEAVELAKNFGSESSSRFINGVLSSVSALASRR